VSIYQYQLALLLAAYSYKTEFFKYYTGNTFRFSQNDALTTKSRVLLLPEKVLWFILRFSCHERSHMYWTAPSYISHFAAIKDCVLLTFKTECMFSWALVHWKKSLRKKLYLFKGQSVTKPLEASLKWRWIYEAQRFKTFLSVITNQ
jgi:hypothetical protein